MGPDCSVFTYLAAHWAGLGLCTKTHRHLQERGWHEAFKGFPRIGYAPVVSWSFQHEKSLNFSCTYLYDDTIPLTHRRGGRQVPNLVYSTLHYGDMGEEVRGFRVVPRVLAERPTERRADRLKVCGEQTDISWHFAKLARDQQSGAHRVESLKRGGSVVQGKYSWLSSRTMSCQVLTDAQYVRSASVYIPCVHPWQTWGSWVIGSRKARRRESSGRWVDLQTALGRAHLTS